MLAVRAHPKILGYLGRALSLELTAVQQYSTQARLVATWGLSEAAGILRKEAEEELQHVNRILERMLAVGVAPGGSQLRPVKLASNLTALLKINLQLEDDIIQLYHSAVHHCAREGDHDNRIFFDELLKEEQQHYAELESWSRRLHKAT